MNTKNSATHRGVRSGTPYRRHPNSGAIEFWDSNLTPPRWCLSSFQDADSLNDTFTFERIESFDDWASKALGVLPHPLSIAGAKAAWEHLTNEYQK